MIYKYMGVQRTLDCFCLFGKIKKIKNSFTPAYIIVMNAQLCACSACTVLTSHPDDIRPTGDWVQKLKKKKKTPLS